MCYAVYISTNSQEDLSRRNSELVRFKKLSEPESDPCTRLLEFPNRWFVGSKSDCSCTFRHATSVDLGFTVSVDWYQEEQDELDATGELFAVLQSLLLSGCDVDLVDRWEGAQLDDIISLDVSLAEISKTTFRMFENHRLRFSRGNLSRI